MLSAWLLHLLDGLGHYVILPGAIEQVLVTTKNITTLGYTYSKLRLKKHPGIFYKLTHTGRLIAWTPLILAWTLALRGRDLYLQRPIPPTTFSRTNNQEGLTTFETSMRYML